MRKADVYLFADGLAIVPELLIFAAGVRLLVRPVPSAAPTAFPLDGAQWPTGSTGLF
ncbi:hypothetical protein [Streptomyces sp. NPDC001642]|uniref:hypothetical protein n=1 Tax=Streptomyces sp. NPDC001642 TaxID=3154392 RepID=UPI00332CA50D